MTVPTPTDLTPTERRRNGLRWVQEGKVSYDPLAASFLVDAKTVTGWDWRTFSEMNQAGWIAITDARAVAAVELTEAGRKILEP
jgi:hypothetical protein